MTFMTFSKQNLIRNLNTNFLTNLIRNGLPEQAAFLL